MPLIIEPFVLRFASQVSTTRGKKLEGSPEARNRRRIINQLSPLNKLREVTKQKRTCCTGTRNFGAKVRRGKKNRQELAGPVKTAERDRLYHRRVAVAKKDRDFQRKNGFNLTRNHTSPYFCRRHFFSLLARPRLNLPLAKKLSGPSDCEKRPERRALFHAIQTNWLISNNPRTAFTFLRLIE